MSEVLSTGSPDLGFRAQAGLGVIQSFTLGVIQSFTLGLGITAKSQICSAPLKNRNWGSRVQGVGFKLAWVRVLFRVYTLSPCGESLKAKF